MKAVAVIVSVFCLLAVLGFSLVAWGGQPLPFSSTDEMNKIVVAKQDANSPCGDNTMGAVFVGEDQQWVVFMCKTGKQPTKFLFVSVGFGEETVLVLGHLECMDDQKTYFVIEREMTAAQFTIEFHNDPCNYFRSGSI